MQRKKTLSAGIFLIMFLTGVLGFFYTPQGAQKVYNQKTKTADGLSINFDVYESKQVIGGPNTKKAIIIGHGFMVNKGAMRLISLDLADQGFLVVSFDFRSHGRSSGTLGSQNGEESQITNNGFLKNDILAIKSYLKKRGDVDMNNLGYVGYSMGGGAGFLTLFEDDDFKAMVGVAPSPNADFTNMTNPKNLLIVVGKYDEAFELKSYYPVMENKTGIPAEEIEIGKTYGSFNNGTAAKLYVDPVMDHLFAPYNKEFIVETRGWFLRALTAEENPPTGASLYNLQIFFVLLGLLGGVGILLVTIKWTAPFVFKEKTFTKSEEINKNSNEKKDLNKDIYQYTFQISTNIGEKGFIKRLALYGFGLSLPSYLFAMVLFLSPVQTSAIMIGIILGPGIALLLLLRSLFKKQGINLGQIFKEQISTQINPLKIFYCLILGGLLYLILNLTVGNIFDIVPGSSKLIMLTFLWPISVIAITFLSLFASVYIENHRKTNPKDKNKNGTKDMKGPEKIKEKQGDSLFSRDQLKIWLKLSLIFVGIVAFDLLIISLAMGSFFIFMELYIAAPLFFLIVFFMVVIFPTNKNSVLWGILFSVPISLIVLVVSPIM